jgi:hypothetical protein
MKATLQFERIDDFLALLVIGPDIPSDADWATWLAFAAKGTSDQPRVVVFTEGGGPSASQRARLKEVFRERRNARVAVMVDSIVARGIATALGWMYGNFTAFPANDFGAALRYLGLDQELASSVSVRVDHLRRLLGDKKKKAG